TRDLSFESSDEFGLIGQRINNMAEDINLLITNRLAFEKERQDIEYQLLQSQINPHFLYNTLGSIKWMATVQNVPGIAKMTTALSRLLKSISKIENVNIPISLECSLLDDYFTIQKYRYGGSIEMKYEVEDTSLLDYSILRFTLQPIVENSIFHGIEPKETAGLITIRIFSPDHNKIQIDIIDNGIGMDSFTIDNLLKANTGCKSNFFKDLGISSVHKRLQYEFGSSYGLSFQSEVGKYTKTSILLPKILSETNVKGEIPSYDDINCR
ncbi:histidine kinase, partial [Lachnotalea glycerini]